MKASKVVKMLNTLIEKHGDLPVCVMASDGEGGHSDQPFSNAVICEGGDKKVKSFLLADRETEIAFS